VAVVSAEQPDQRLGAKADEKSGPEATSSEVRLAVLLYWYNIEVWEKMDLGPVPNPALLEVSR